MNCANHPDQPATGFCRNCGKPLCSTCQRPAQGTIFCEEHEPVPQASAASPYAASYAASPQYPPPPPPGATPYNYGPNPYAPGANASPGLAFLLGLIPGVGAIYNGQYAKGLIHAIILGLLISIMNAGAAGGLEPLIGMITALWFFYMAFEAYHTAAKRVRGEPVDEFSSIFPMNRSAGRGFPVGPVLLIVIGIIFLLNTLEIVRLYEILRFWPVFLIILGGYMLYLRVTDRAEIPPARETVRE